MSDPNWAKIKIVLIVLGVLVFIVAAVSLSSWLTRRQTAAAAAYAGVRGWTFFERDDRALGARFAGALWGLRSYDLTNIRIVEEGARSIYLCDIRYRFREEASGRPYSRGVACLIASDRFAGVGTEVDIVGRGFLDFMVADRVELVGSPFADRYQLQSLDPEGARAVAGDEVLAVLAAYDSRPEATPAWVSLAPGQAAVLAGQVTDQSDLQDLLDLALRIEGAMP